MSYHYTYRLTDPSCGDFYVGVRSSVLSPEDDAYMGSGRWAKHRVWEGCRLAKEILAVFETRQDAEAAELALIDASLLLPRCRNSIKTASAAFKKKHCKRTRFGLYLNLEVSAA